MEVSDRSWPGPKWGKCQPLPSSSFAVAHVAGVAAGLHVPVYRLVGLWLISRSYHKGGARKARIPAFGDQHWPGRDGQPLVGVLPSHGE
jgi:hypothetical protein